jgi:murein L,D-transpeptidase YafK
MRYLVIFISFLFLISGTDPLSFRDQQMVYTRVKEAYADKERTVINTIAGHSISRDSLRIYLRIFKSERKIELWARNVSDTVMVLIKEFPICDISGYIGPKRCSHDLQVPEGFYHIKNMNPYSKYYLSIQINYPNKSDSIRGVRGHLGNLIFIHGECISSGCIAITNDRIKELYVYCIEAYNSGQQQIDLAIFPTRLTDNTYSSLTARYRKEQDKISLWADLKKSFDLFEYSKLPPVARFLPDGKHDLD